MSYAGLVAAVDGLKFRPGWLVLLAVNTKSPEIDHAPEGVTRDRLIFWPESGVPLFLVVTMETRDSWGPHEGMQIEHQFDVPPEPGRGGWSRWLLERLLDVDRHEAMENFEIDGVRPFYPHHEGRYQGSSAAAERHTDLYEISERWI